MGLFSRRQRTPEEEERLKHLIELYFIDHISGLPLAPYAKCVVKLYDDMIIIDSSGVKFNLPMERVIDVSNQENMSPHEIAASPHGVRSAPGGRIRRATVITYDKDGELENIVFSSREKSLGEGSFVKEFKKIKKARGTAEVREIDL